VDAAQVVALALLQGLTEFLPISSSAHLILLPLLVDWPDQGLAFDVAVHVGTLLAVLAYFRTDLRRMSRDWLRSLRQRAPVGDSRLVWFVLVGTLPVGVCGLALGLAGADFLRSAAVIATASVLFALVLWWSDAVGARERDEHGLTWRDALIIGAAQALALVPGTSRSGITMTAGLALGLRRESAARFSFLLAIPVIALAGALEATKAWASDAPVDWGATATAAVVAAASAYACIHAFLKLVERVGMLPFVLYRLLLGAALFAFVV